MVGLGNDAERARLDLNMLRKGILWVDVGEPLATRRIHIVARRLVRLA